MDATNVGALAGALTNVLGTYNISSKPQNFLHPHFQNSTVLSALGANCISIMAFISQTQLSYTITSASSFDLISSERKWGMGYIFRQNVSRISNRNNACKLSHTYYSLPKYNHFLEVWVPFSPYFLVFSRPSHHLPSIYLPGWVCGGKKSDVSCFLKGSLINKM